MNEYFSTMSQSITSCTEKADQNIHVRFMRSAGKNCGYKGEKIIYTKTEPICEYYSRYHCGADIESILRNNNQKPMS